MNGFARIHVRVLKLARGYHVTDRVFIKFENWGDKISEEVFESIYRFSGAVALRFGPNC